MFIYLFYLYYITVKKKKNMNTIQFIKMVYILHNVEIMYKLQKNLILLDNLRRYFDCHYYFLRMLTCIS